MGDRLAGAALIFSTLAGCSSALVSRFPIEQIPVPERASEYVSEARPDGAVGGPGAGQLAARVRATLAERGENAVADGALASTACWALHRVHGSQPPDTVMVDAASRRFGFGGVISAFIAFATDSELWREQLGRVPSNLRLNRFGVCVSPSGKSAELVLGAQEMQYATLPRDFEPGASVTISGSVSPRFQFAHIYLSKPDGTVDERRTTSRAVDATFELAAVGQYRLEVMGDGATGPVIVTNMPLYVGVEEPAIRENSGISVEPEVAEKRMLELLNEGRKTAGVAPLLPDAELRRIAEAHTRDMAEHHFMSHVSPSSGTPEERAKRSGILVSLFGENLAAAPTPEDAYTGLMESPGHRANMLRREFTHVGIAAATTDAGLILTLNFGRRPRPEEVPTGAQVEAAFAALRRDAGLSAAVADPIYRAGAQAAADAMAAGLDDGAVAKAESAAMQREVDRVRTSRPAACVFRAELLEVDQLKQLPGLLSPDLRRFGVGTHLHRDGKGARLSTVFVLEGVRCP
jgi:uncharacterized protein YkwD